MRVQRAGGTPVTGRPVLLLPCDAQGHPRGDSRPPGAVQEYPGDTADARYAVCQLRQKTAEHLSQLPPQGEGRLRPEDERGRAGHIHGACPHPGLRAGQREHQQARSDQGPALAQHQVGAVHRGKRPRPHTDEEGGHRRGPRVRGKRRQDTERHHAPRLHPQHHQPLGHRGPRDGHVRQRGLRPGTPRHILRPCGTRKEMNDMELKTDYSDIHFADNGRIKLLIIVGTRPEIIRLAAVINKTRKYFDVLLAHTGQNYDYNLNGIFFRDLKLEDPDVYMNAVGDDLGATCGNIINASYKLMAATKPDAVLVLGDTNSCLSVIGAKRLHIPIFHMEAGNRCKDECLPEETNRRIVDIISDVNMAYSEHARRYLAECGLPRERTFVTGSPMAEVLHENLAEIEASDIHSRLGLEKGKYILLSAHREENIDTEKNFLSLFNAINAMAEKYDMPVLYSCHPRSRNRLVASGFKLDGRVIQHEPLGFHDYNCLQMNAFAVVSDSGTLPEESSFFTSVGYPFPAVCIRTSTERPEAIDKGDFIIAGIDEKSLLQAVDTAVSLNRDGFNGIPVPDYVDENVSTKVVKIIQSYTGIVNKMVWRKL